VAESEKDAPTGEIDPEALDYETAKAIVENTLPDEAELNASFIAGDHWQEREGWIGPTPPEDDEDLDTTMDLIEAGFTSRNVIREIVRRRVRGVIGKEPRFGVVPRAITEPGKELEDAKKKLKQEIEAALTEWWDRRRVHRTLDKAVSRAQWCERGPIRVYIPRALAPDGSIPRQPTLADALRFVHVEAPDPLFSTVAIDEDTQDEVGIILTSVGEDKVAEVVYLGEADTAGKRMTLFRTISEKADAKGGEAVELDLGGRITMASIETDLLITEQQQQMQRALNLCLTMIPHNIVTGGFLERIILNGLPPGHWEKDDRGRNKRFVREPYVTGAGVTQWISGIEIPNPKDGSVAVTSPTVAWRQPVDPAFATNAKRAIYQDMLEEADQAHVLISSDATASGVSRVQARADFDMSLTELEGPTNSVGRWLIDVALAIAETLMESPGSFTTEWRGQFECRVTSAPLSIEERQQTVDEMNASLRAPETTMEEIGVQDVEAERARIAADPDMQLGTLKKRTAIVLELTNAGADIEAAAEIAGIEDAASLVPDDVPPSPGGPDDDEDDEDEDPAPPAPPAE
jgi:hypothetical protein